MRGVPHVQLLGSQRVSEVRGRGVLEWLQLGAWFDMVVLRDVRAGLRVGCWHESGARRATAAAR
jgi:hypothetical protein